MNMKKKTMNEKASYENRYKYKLNMLWPGQIMIKIVGALLLIGFLCWFLKWQIVALSAWISAGIVFTVLLVLVAVELHQDKVLNEIAMHENKERENR